MVRVRYDPLMPFTDIFLIKETPTPYTEKETSLFSSHVYFVHHYLKYKMCYPFRIIKSQQLLARASFSAY